MRTRGRGSKTRKYCGHPLWMVPYLALVWQAATSLTCFPPHSSLSRSEGGKCSEFCTFGMEPWTNIEHRPSILCNFFALWLFRPAPRRTANSFLRRFGTTGATLSDRITYHVSKGKGVATAATPSWPSTLSRVHIATVKILPK